MHLTESTIQAVRNASISDVVGKYVKLKKSGSALTGLCPFHDERSPSFSVSESKGIFKCFGCGAGGDAIGFVMKHERKDFIESVEIIAGICGIPLEYEEVPDKEKYEKQKTEKEKLKAVMRFTVDLYKKTLWDLQDDHPVMQYLADRKITRKEIAEWQLGWATDEWQFLSQSLISNNWYNEAVQLGLIKRTADNERNYDVYRNRIIIPITNHQGEYIGIAGRLFPSTNAADNNGPKYINPVENPLYQKSKLLFGLSQADKAINREGKVFLTEGYFDVISLHSNSDEHTVATCGTALTVDQAKLLRKYTGHVVVLRDGDKAGHAAAVKDLYILLKAGFKVEVALLPEGEDPDSYIRKQANGPIAANLPIEDGIYWHVQSLVKDVFDDTYKLGQAQQKVLELLLEIPNDIYRGNYLDGIIKKYKWRKAKLQKRLGELVEERTAAEQDEEDDGVTHLDKMPKWMDREEFNRLGYCCVNNKKRTGYYGYGQSGHVEYTNFLIKPLFHIYAARESEYLIQINNGKRTAVLEIEAKAMVNIDMLQQFVVCEGPFIIYATKNQMLRVATDLLNDFPRCEKIKFLGWQTAGFYAFVDQVYIPGQGLKQLDEWGIIKHGEENYLVPAASAAYRHLQSRGEDPYESDRYLTYKQTSMKFSEWGTLMHRVYGDKGNTAIAYAILTLFRDIIFDVDNNCPHLYAFGERSSGKSKWAESIGALFFKKRPAFNLNSGTDFAFFSYMQRFVNAISHLNEFDEKVIRPEWFQAIKGVFDGEGRQRGVMGSKNRTEIMKIHSTLVLTGQYLCTMDDNSIVSRSIIEGFNERELNEEDKIQYNKLKALEETGLSSMMLEVLAHRHTVKAMYREVFNENLSKWRSDFAASGNEQNNQRIMQNWCHLFTSWQFIAKHIQLPVSEASFEGYCKANATKWSSFIRSSDTLSEFWNTFAFLVDQGLLIEGWDFKIQLLLDVAIRKNREEEYRHQFEEPTKVLFVRMNNVHKHYQQAFRTRTGKEGMTMENLLHYFSSRKYYVGPNKQSRFKRFVTKTENVTIGGFAGSPGSLMPQTSKHEESITSSSYVFLYGGLNLDIERNVEDQADEIPIPGFKPVTTVDFKNT